ncbi:MAG: hypothetical protein Q9174_000780 [Haloplaca sp. 1 TL-2023]
MSGVPKDDPESYEDGIAGFSGLRSSALSNKLNGVLSVSYTDSEISDALRLLDHRNAINTPHLRRNLRLDLQKDVIESNASIVKDFGQVAEQLKRIGSSIASLEQCCASMRHHVAAARQDNAPVLDEATALLDQRQGLEKKRQLLAAFQKHFVLPEEDIMRLSTSTEAIDDSFFALLTRIKQIHSDCRVLLGGENQRLGLELMEQSSRNLNSAYQKLYSCIQSEFQTLDLENPRINASIRRSLYTLAERPALFESCLNTFSETREQNLTDSFYAALTGSSISQQHHLMTKPIEYHAHDALRYIGDMLAWVHSATVSERESLETLFISEVGETIQSVRAGQYSEPCSASDDNSFNGEKALNTLVNRNVVGVARALRQRVEQAVQGQDDSVAVYKIANLISFYRVTLAKLLGVGSSVMEALSSLEGSARRQFETLQSDQTANMQAELTQAPSDSSVPALLDDSLLQLTALMKSYESSLTPVGSREEDFAPILSQTLKPVLDACQTIARNLDAPSHGIFLLNCYLAARKTLQPFVHFTQLSLSHIEEQIQLSTSDLVEYQHHFFLHVSGLHPLLADLAPLSDSATDLRAIRTLPKFQPAALTEAKQTLDDFLPSASIDALENLKELSDSNVAVTISSDAADRFCEDFEFVERRLVAVDETLATDENDSDEGQETKAQEQEEGRVLLKGVYPRTTGEIRVLLS